MTIFIRLLCAVSAVLAIGYWLLRDELGPSAPERAAAEFHSAGPFQVSIALEPAQPKVGENRITLTLRDQAGRPVAGAKVRAIAEMPAMGAMPAMQAPAEIEELEPGRYVGSFDLTMSGEWPLTLDIDSDSLGHGQILFEMATGRAGLRPPMRADQPQAAAAPTGRIAVDARRRQLIGVTTARVQRQRLRPAIRAAGQVTYDERRLTDVALKFDGWVGKLHANYVGAPVRRGEILLTVYSPELVSAQEEYLDTLRRRKTGNDTLIAAARRRLARWNMGTAEIRALESRGAGSDYVSIRAPASGTVIEKNIVAGTAVKAGDTLMRIADLATVWVEAQVYEYEVSLVRIGMAAEITLPSLPGRIFEGRVSYIYPALDGPTRTARLRIDLDNPEGLLHPQAYTQVQLTADLGERLLVPDSAVIYAGATRVVFVDRGQGYLEPRKVSVGHRAEGKIEVLEGLSEGEVVVTSGNFLIAAESKLKAGIDQW